jgi:hypothetical protein
MAIADKIDQLALQCLKRPVTHLTTQYILNRLHVWVYQCRHPDTPWLTRDAISILSSVLRKSDNGLEYGSGRSTLWFAQRTNSLISIEASRVWYDRVSGAIRNLGISNTFYKYIPANPELLDDPYRVPYIEADNRIACESLDYALIDGFYRDECALRVVDLLRPGGLLILDNANRFIPHVTRSPFSVATIPTRFWSEFLLRIATSRLIWTSNGIWDTAVWFKTL